MAGPANIHVSVIIPVFNGAQYLGEAIESVLGQTYPSIELLIVDDGSTDDTAGIVDSYSPLVRYRYQQNAGLGSARNRGVADTTGDLVAFLDADDLWGEQKITTQVQYLTERPSVKAVFAFMESFISPDLGQSDRNRLALPPAPQPAWSAGTMLARRPALSAVGPFPTHVQIGEFMDWLLRAREIGLEMAMLPEVMMRRRIHRTNMGREDESGRGDYARILKASLDRRRTINSREGGD
jgi:glycosyltransferase involved in cell wall biosynthesis